MWQPVNIQVRESRPTGRLFEQNQFWVTVARGIHPFPSRTRKLSLSAPMVLHAQVCGRVGSRPIKQQQPRRDDIVSDRGFAFVAQTSTTRSSAMDLLAIIAVLREERDRLSQAISALERLAREGKPRRRRVSKPVASTPGTKEREKPADEPPSRSPE